MSLLGEYNTGSATVDNGATTVTLASGVTSSLVAGDYFFAANSVGLIASITDSTHFELQLPWQGTDVAAGDYVVAFLSPQRYSPTYNGQKVRQLITLLDSVGIIYYVPDDLDVPDPANGDNGNFAIKIVPGAAWTFWVKEAGVWVNLGAPLGVAWEGLWSSATAYITNDIVSRLGIVYIALQAGTNHAPESSPTYWDVLFQGGNRYDLAFDASDRPDSGDMFRRFVFTTNVQFISGMADSRANAGFGATASAAFSFRKNNVEFATLTFAPVGVTVTATITTPGVVTDTAHGFSAGQTVVFTTSGSLPTGITGGAVYYVLAAGLTANSYRIGETAGGSAINTSGTQSGVHKRFASSTGTFACPTTTTFAAGDVLTMVAPDPRDATLADLAITITGYR